MDKKEMLELRKTLVERVERLRKVGDWGAGASDIRDNSESLLKLTDHLLERMRS